MPTHLHLDPFSGVAGDMFLGALVDLGVDLQHVRAALAKLPTQRPYDITTQRVSRHGIGAVDLKVTLQDQPDADHAAAPEPEPTPHAHGRDAADHGHQHGHDHDHSHKHDHGHHHHDHGHAHKHDHGHSHSHHHPHDHAHHHHHTGYREVMAMVEQLDTTPRGRERAGAVVHALAEAEARVHGKSLDEVHFHEVGAIDSIVDMLGSVVALELLGVDSLSCGVLPISSGWVRCEHGLMPVPAPATAYLLEGLPTAGVDRRGELITPTGAALVRALCAAFGPPPPMTVRGVGYGAGDREDPAVPNLLRMFLGQTETDAAKLLPAQAHRDAIQTDGGSATLKREGVGHAHPHAHEHGHQHDHDHDQGHAHPHTQAHGHEHGHTHHHGPRDHAAAASADMTRGKTAAEPTGG